MYANHYERAAQGVIDRIHREGGFFIAVRRSGSLGIIPTFLGFVTFLTLLTLSGIGALASGNLEPDEHWKPWITIVLAQLLVAGSIYTLAKHVRRRSCVAGVEFVREGLRIVGRGSHRNDWPPVLTCRLPLFER